MILNFEKIKYKNLLSSGSKPIEIDLSKHHRTLITGVNGAGKSTFLEAISFGVFGKPFRKIKKGQLVNSVNKKQCLVEIWLSTGKDKFYIKRGIKPDILEFKKNGKIVEEDASTRDFQKVIEGMLGINFHTFKQIIVLGTAGYQPFLELSTGKKREFSEDILDVSVYGKMSELNKKTLSEIKANMEKLELRIQGVRNEIEAHRSHIENYKRQNQKHLESLQRMYDEYAEQARQLKSDVLRITEEISQVEKDLDSDVEEQLRATSSKIARLETKIDRVNHDIEFFTDNSTCNSCGQDISESVKSSSIERLEREKASIDSDYNSTKAEHQKVTRSVEEYRKRRTHLQSLRHELSTKKASLVEAVNSVKSVKSKMEEKAELDVERLKSLKTKLTDLRDEKNTLFEEKYARGIVLTLLKDTGIKADVVEQYIPVINKKVNEFLKRMGADYTMTVDSSFNESIKTVGKESFTYSSFSQGEKARIDISFLFTWRAIAEMVSGVKINLLILDEVFDSAADSTGIKAIQQVLNDIGGNIFIISHRESHDKENFDHHIKMTKKGRFTQAL